MGEGWGGLVPQVWTAGEGSGQRETPVVLTPGSGGLVILICIDVASLVVK